MLIFESDIADLPGQASPVKSGVVHLSSTSPTLPCLHFWSSDLAKVVANAVPFKNKGYNTICTTIFTDRDLWMTKYSVIALLSPGEFNNNLSRNMK